jgi:hypothetical protein
VAFLVDVVKKTKEQRRLQKEEKWNDFLQLMLNAAAEEKGEGGDETQANNVKNNTKKRSTTGNHN